MLQAQGFFLGVRGTTKPVPDLRVGEFPERMGSSVRKFVVAYKMLSFCSMGMGADSGTMEDELEGISKSDPVCELPTTMCDCRDDGPASASELSGRMSAIFGVSTKYWHTSHYLSRSPPGLI